MMSASQFYNLFMTIGAIASGLALIGFVGAWFASSKISKDSSNQISNLQAEIIQQRRSLTEKDVELVRLKDNLNDFREYEWLARLDMFGRPLRVSGEGLQLETDLTRALNGLYVVNDQETTFRDDLVAISVYRKVAIEQDKFPLPHYILAMILHQKNDSEWRIHAIRANEIIGRVIQIPEHHGWYD